MTQLTSLPPEIIEEILLHLDPIYVACIAGCSRLLRYLVYSAKDQALWRELYLKQTFDDPRKCVSPQGSPRVVIDWKGELQRFIRARNVLDNPLLCRPGERYAILLTILEIISYVPPLSSPQDLHMISDNLMWVAATLRRGAFLEEPNTTAEEAQLCARLHTYFGLTNSDTKRASRVQSRAFVYDMRNYQPDNAYGPFDAKGCVNWVHVQALHHVVSMHLVDLREDESFEFAIFPLSLPFTQIVVPPDGEESEDWAGVVGAWRVSFCFCDHRELLSTSWLIYIYSILALTL